MRNMNPDKSSQRECYYNEQVTGKKRVYDVQLIKETWH